MNFDELSLEDRVALYVLPALLSASDMRKSMSNKTIIHEARKIAEDFLASVAPMTDRAVSPPPIFDYGPSF
ncbi:MAG: hypothetical protein LBG78_09010 [Azoarcus sp.]|nr:hypothetical protein [Azoarcus sp.]